jgi:hypothetical protein
MLEPFEENLGELLETARPAPALSEGWQARAIARMAAAAGEADRKETVPMRRLAYAMVFVLVIGLAAGVFTRTRTPSGKSLLIGVAQAMEAARSIHVIAHGNRADSTSPSGMRFDPEPDEMWESVDDHGVVRRDLQGGVLLSAHLGALRFQPPVRPGRSGTESRSSFAGHESPTMVCSTGGRAGGATVSRRGRSRRWGVWDNRTTAN